MAGVNNDLITEGRGAEADHDLVAQPHQQEGPVAEAETTAAEMSSDEQPLGRLGRRFDRRSPFLVGMAAAAVSRSPTGRCVFWNQSLRYWSSSAGVLSRTRS